MIVQNQRGASTPQKIPQANFITAEETFQDSKEDSDIGMEEEDVFNNETTIIESKDVTPLNAEALQAYLEQYPTLLIPLLTGYVEDTTKNVYDPSPVTGVNYAIDTSKVIVGNTELDFDNTTGDIIVGQKVFKGTKGLYELLFKKEPVHFTDADQNTYVDLLEVTNAIYRNHNPKEQFQGIGTGKYTHIVKPILHKRKRERENARNETNLGDELSQFQKELDRSGLLFRERSMSSSGSFLRGPNSYLGSGFGDAKLRVEKKPYRYMYWNDPNELIERLCFLHASKRAGNTSHGNEIRAIEEELREANIIY